MKRVIVALILAASLRAQPQPTLPYIDQGACPFETCHYGNWNVREAVIVFDTWQATRHEVAKLQPGAKVTAITGLVITERPGVIRMDRDLGELKQGDAILVYTTRGEGYYAAWFKDSFHHDYDLSFAKLLDGTGCGNAHCAAKFVDEGEMHWWAQIKLATGQTGWVDMSRGQLGGFDM